MKKRKLSGIAAMVAIAAVAVVNVTLSNTKTSMLTDLQLANVEALAAPPESSPPPTKSYYNKVTGPCEKEFTVGLDGYITMRKVPFQTGLKAGTIYRAYYSDVQIDCQINGSSITCKDCTCANFWLDQCPK